MVPSVHLRLWCLTQFSSLHQMVIECIKLERPESKRYQSARFVQLPMKEVCPGPLLLFRLGARPPHRTNATVSREGLLALGRPGRSSSACSFCPAPCLRRQSPCLLFCYLSQRLVFRVLVLSCLGIGIWHLCKLREGLRAPRLGSRSYLWTYLLGPRKGRGVVCTFPAQSALVRSLFFLTIQTVVNKKQNLLASADCAGNVQTTPRPFLGPTR